VIENLKEPVTIEALMLANHVEAVNGLLYMSGGGWTDHYRAVQPNGQAPVSHFGIGLSLRIPWNETNQPHHLNVRVENEDATIIIANIDTQINVGRPPQLALGSIQHAVIGVSIDTMFPRAGGYRIVARIGEDGDSKTWPFRVHDTQVASLATPQMPPA